MEIFIPGLIILIIAGFYVFLVLPRLGPMVLAVVSLIALILAGINHYSLFYNEYKMSTWQTSLASYTPWIILGIAIITMITSLLFMFSGSSGATNATNATNANMPTPMETIQNAISNSFNNMPSANSATNPFTAAINSAISEI